MQFTEQQIREAFPRDPWPHQLRGLVELFEKLEQYNSIVLCSPVGGGKGLMQSTIANLVNLNSDGLILYNSRRTLTDQSYERLTQDGIDCGVRAASRKKLQNLPARIQVASLQTDIQRVINQEVWQLHDAKYVIIDEAHLSMSGRTVELIQMYLAAGAKVIGVTGTPVGMAGLYKDVVVAGTNSELRACGAHVPMRIWNAKEMDVSHIKPVKTGEYTDGDIQRECWSMQIVGHIVDDFFKYNPDIKPTMAACPGVGESIWLADKFIERGMRVLHLDANEVVANGERYKNDAEGVIRRQAIEDFRKGMYDVITNCEVLQQGVDIPELAHLILARPYGSLANFLQTAGRIQRRSPSTPDMVTLQDHGANCLDEKTEVLTRNGWAGIDDEITEVAAYHETTGEITYEPVTDRIERTVLPGERMVSCKSRQTDFRVTEGHRMLAKRRTTHKGKVVWSNNFIIEAMAMQDSNLRFKMPVSGTMEGVPVKLIDYELELLGWYLSDGTINLKNPNIRSLTINQAAHQPHIKELKQCLMCCQLDWTEREQKGSRLSNREQRRFDIPKGTCKSRPRKGWYKYKKYLGKHLSDELMNIPRRQLLSLLQGIHLGDGSKAKSGASMMIYTGHKQFADRLQQLCVTRGIKCNIHTRPVKHNAKALVQQKNPLYTLNIQHNTTHTTVHGIHTKTKDKQAKLEIHPAIEGERVWCVSNRVGTLVTRRNGVVLMMGNCYRHGSPNADRDWHELFHQTEADIAKERKEREKSGEAAEKAPITCPQCQMVRSEGARCPNCGTISEKGRRVIMEKSGELVEFMGNIAKAPPKPTVPIEQKFWDSLYWASRNSKSPRARTFSQAKYEYERQHGPLPDWLKRIPKDQADYGRKIRDVDWSELT